MYPAGLYSEDSPPTRHTEPTTREKGRRPTQNHQYPVKFTRGYHNQHASRRATAHTKPSAQCKGLTTTKHPPRHQSRERALQKRVWVGTDPSPLSRILNNLRSGHMSGIDPAKPSPLHATNVADGSLHTLSAVLRTSHASIQRQRLTPTTNGLDRAISSTTINASVGGRQLEGSKTTAKDLLAKKKRGGIFFCYP